MKLFWPSKVLNLAPALVLIAEASGFVSVLYNKSWSGKLSLGLDFTRNTDTVVLPIPSSLLTLIRMV